MTQARQLVKSWTYSIMDCYGDVWLVVKKMRGFALEYSMLKLCNLF